SGPLPAPRSVWIHGASVGEILAGAKLSDRLQAAGHVTCASTMTLTGRETMRRVRPDVPCGLAPLDHPWLVEAALSRVRPSALVLIETELWPSWIAAAARHDVPVIVTSGRISFRSFPRYRRLAPLLHGTFARLSAVGARTEEDARRFVALGVPAERVQVCGDLKLGPPEPSPELSPELERRLPDCALLVAGSTHGGEEEAALAALEAAEGAGVSAALVLAPRYPERADEVARVVRRAGRPLVRASDTDGGNLPPGGVLLLDGLGDLAAMYTRATVAFVGGSLVPRGGHNLLEPAAAGRLVLFGPHTENAEGAAALLIACGAGERVADASALAAAVARWLADPEVATQRGRHGRRALESHRGSVERNAALVEAILSERSVHREKRA
ncbi:MAG TPA: glycosyltransferase N-terminal domain-containing protein, partial [Myxococcota bacterium]|nr:glycosyltransferase N-terminal domain-containing protein [Myxococcota bacterium]